MGAVRLPGGPVSSDALHRVDAFRLTGTHALVPLHRVASARIELAEIADWFALADLCGAARLTVTVSALPSVNLTSRSAEIREAVLDAPTST